MHHIGLSRTNRFFSLLDCCAAVLRMLAIDLYGVIFQIYDDKGEGGGWDCKLFG